MNVAEWDKRSNRSGLHAVFSSRWSEDECLSVDKAQEEIVFRLLPDLRRWDVLDLGCGIGRLSARLAERSAKVVGLDISDGMLERARLEVRQPHVSFVRASAGELPFRKEAFDVVLASYVLQHILEESLFDRALNEIARIIKPHGLALLIDSLAEEYHLPSNSVVTVIRTWKQYAPMESQFQLLHCQAWRCVEDDYTVMLWGRRGIA